EAAIRGLRMSPELGGNDVLKFFIMRGKPSRRASASAIWPASHRAHQWLFLRHAEPWASRHIRPAQHHQLRAWRAIYDGRVRVLSTPQQWRFFHRLLACPDPVPGDRRIVRPALGTESAFAAKCEEQEPQL